MKVAALLMEITDVQAIGTEIGAGLYVSASFYWDRDEGTRALTKAVQAAMPGGEPPNMIQAGCYASTLHYLKAVTAMGVDKARDGAAVCAQMKAMPTDDEAFGKNTHPQGRPVPAAGVPVPGEDAGREPRQVGPAEAGRHHAG